MYIRVNALHARAQFPSQQSFFGAMMNLVKTTLTIAFLFASLHSVAISQLLQWTQANGPYNTIPSNSFTANKDTLIFATGWGHVYRSTDFGNNWIAGNNGERLAEYGRLFKIITHNTVVFAATNRGVSRSFDNGNTWQSVSSGLAYRLSANSGTMTSVVNLFSSGDVIFAGTLGGGLFRSSNLGETWVSANAGLNFGYIHAIGKYKSTLYISTELGIYISEDNGASWKTSRLPLSQVGEPIYYFFEIGDTFIAGPGFSGGYRTSNNGESWSRMNISNPLWFFNMNGKLLCGALDPVNSKFVLLQSLDKGITWKQIPVNIPISRIEFMAENNGYVFAFTYEGIYRSSDEGNSWTITSKGLNFNTINAFLFKDKILYSGTLNGIYRSTDLGINWTPINSGLKDLVVKTIATDGNNLYLATRESGVYRSTNNGENWTQINKGLPTTVINTIYDTEVNTIYASTGGTLFVGTQGNGIYRSVDKGENWLPINSGLNPQIPINSIIEKDNLLFAGTLDVPYVSNIEGTHWNELSSGFPPGLNTGIASLCVTNGTIYAATVFGIYKSQDNGKNWVNASVNNGLRTVCQSVVAYKGRLFAGCSGEIYGSLDSAKTWSLLYERKDDIVLTNFPALFVEGDTIVAGSTYFGIFRAGYLKPTGIESFQEASTNFHVFPNPTTDVMTIRLPRSLLQVITVRIVNSLGQEVRRLEVYPTDGSSQLQLNTQELNNGAYVVQVMMGKDMFTKKFLIAK